MRALSVITTICAPSALASLVSAFSPALERSLHDEPVAIATPRPLPPPVPPPLTPRAAVQPARPADPTAKARSRGFVGVFVSNEAANVAAPSAGRLASVRVRIGERVQAGEVVASLEAQAQELDVKVAQAQERELRAELGVMRARAEIAADQQQRVTALSGSGLASGGERAAADGQRREALLRAQLARAGTARQRVAIERLERARDERNVLAPFEGLVVARYEDAGNSVTPDRPILRIVRDGPLIVRFALPEASPQRIDLGMLVHARAVALGYEIDATVRRISAEIDSAGRFSVVEAETASIATPALAGAAAEVFLGGSRDDAQR